MVGFYIVLRSLREVIYTSAARNKWSGSTEVSIITIAVYEGASKTE